MSKLRIRPTDPVTLEGKKLVQSWRESFFLLLVAIVVGFLCYNPIVSGQYRQSELPTGTHILKNYDTAERLSSTLTENSYITLPYSKLTGTAMLHKWFFVVSHSYISLIILIAAISLVVLAKKRINFSTKA